MKVLLLGPYPPPHGGVQTHLVALRDFLRQRGITCGVVNLTRFRQPDGDNVYYPRSAWELLRILLRLRYDIVHLHIGGNLSLRLLGLCMICSLFPWAESVLTFHSGGYPTTPAGRKAGPWSLRGFVLQRMSHLIAVNQQLAELFQRFGCDPKHVSLVSPHATGSGVGGQDQADASLPPDLGAFYDSHNPVLVTVGLLEPEYDLELQIDCVERLRSQFPDAGLVIIGSGSLEEPLRKRVAGSAAAPHILLRGDVPHPITLQAIARCDVFLRTTLYDGDSISVREALQLGTPVIATDNRMRPQGVRLIPASDPQALRTMVTEVLTRPHTAPSLPPEAGTANLEAVLRIYEQLVQTK